MLHRFLSVLVAPAVVVVAFCTAAAAQNPVSIGPFDVYFPSAGSGSSFTFRGRTYTPASSWTSAQIQDITTAVQAWSNTIANSYGPRRINVCAVWDSNIGSSLAISDNDFALSGQTAYTNAEYIWRQGALPGSSQTYDAVWAFNPSYAWNAGGVWSLPYTQYDLLSVACHEVGHTLGFSSCYYNSQTGLPQDDRWYLWQPGSPSTLTPAVTTWDGWLRDLTVGGNQPAPGSTGTPNNFNEAAGQCFWGGPIAGQLYWQTRSQYPSLPLGLPIYAPTTLQWGSSLTHVDTVLSPLNTLMDPFRSVGPAGRLHHNGHDGGEWATNS